MPREIEDYWNGEEPWDWDPTQGPDAIPPAPPPQEPPATDENPFEDAITVAATEAPQTTETLPTTTGLALHLDGDYLAYYASGNDDTVAGQARNNALDLIESFRSRIGADEVYVHNTADASNKGERYLVAQVKPYQGHRKGSRKPRNHAYLRNFLLNYDGTAFTTQVWADREADDAIAASAYQAIGGAVGYAGISTKDKDMRMLPGHHIDWTTRDVTVVAPGEYAVIGSNGKLHGIKWFWQQMLEGDTADAIPGLEYYKNARGALLRLGPKTAEKFLADTTTSDEAAAIVMELYEGAYQDYWPDRFVEQAALLWMRLGSTAGIDDFATHMGHSRINTAFPQEVFDAVTRMNERVTDARAALDALGS